MRRLDQPFPSCDRLHGRLRLLTPHHHETPGLHKANRRRLVGSFEQSAQEVIRYRVGTEAADVTTLGYDAHHSAALIAIEPPPARATPPFPDPPPPHPPPPLPPN